MNYENNNISLGKKTTTTPMKGTKMCFISKQVSLNPLYLVHHKWLLAAQTQTTHPPFTVRRVINSSSRNSVRSAHRCQSLWHLPHLDSPTFDTSSKTLCVPIRIKHSSHQSSSPHFSCFLFYYSRSFLYIEKNTYAKSRRNFCFTPAIVFSP